VAAAVHAITREDKIAIRIFSGSARIVNPLDMIDWKVSPLPAVRNWKHERGVRDLRALLRLRDEKFICRRLRLACKAKAAGREMCIELECW